ncbi:hypothetical protein L5515_010136 [Caenorhabditis briggsae]|uniref:One cut domain family member n=2 Tax=Caenorhabditis briggsae TaxID=6238 RepID=A0AAE9JDR1_CAEBR|nr:hypothetical protein L5515_010136 [Caenorhabditis briggsae]
MRIRINNETIYRGGPSRQEDHSDSEDDGQDMDHTDFPAPDPNQPGPSNPGTSTSSAGQAGPSTSGPSTSTVTQTTRDRLRQMEAARFRRFGMKPPLELDDETEGLPRRQPEQQLHFRPINTKLGQKYKLNANASASDNLDLVLKGIGIDVSKLPTPETPCRIAFIVDGLEPLTLEEKCEMNDRVIRERTEARTRKIAELFEEDYEMDEVEPRKPNPARESKWDPFDFSFNHFEKNLLRGGVEAWPDEANRPKTKRQLELESESAPPPARQEPRREHQKERRRSRYRDTSPREDSDEAQAGTPPPERAKKHKPRRRTAPESNSRRREASESDSRHRTAPEAQAGPEYNPRRQMAPEYYASGYDAPEYDAPEPPRDVPRPPEAQAPPNYSNRQHAAPEASQAAPTHNPRRRAHPETDSRRRTAPEAGVVLAYNPPEPPQPPRDVPGALGVPAAPEGPDLLAQQFNIPEICAAMAVKVPEGTTVDTKDLCNRLAQDLKDNSIPQSAFSTKILGRSQGTLSDILRNPKPWDQINRGAETYERMINWLGLEKNLRVELCQLSPKDAARVTGLQITHPQKRQEGHGPRTRLVFTDTQKAKLVDSFKRNPNPPPEHMAQLAVRLHLDLPTVRNFFVNYRRRLKDGRFQKEMEKQGGGGGASNQKAETVQRAEHRQVDPQGEDQVAEDDDDVINID